MRVLALTLLAFAFVAAGCSEVTQILNPSDVGVSVTTPEQQTQVTPGNSNNNSVVLSLDPPGPITLEIGKRVSVKVIARVSSQEVPTESLSVTVVDTSVATVDEIDGRFVAFRGQAAGLTTAIINANGATTAAAITVQ